VSPGHTKPLRLLHASTSSRDRSNHSPLSRGKRLGQARTQPVWGKLDPCGPTSAAPKSLGAALVIGLVKPMQRAPALEDLKSMNAL
jgi:hypothetical protein